MNFCSKPALIFLALLLCSGAIVGAEDLASLDKKITVAENQIRDLSKQYEKQQGDLDQTLTRIEQARKQGTQSAVDSQTKIAYSATDTLNELLNQLNNLKSTRETLCASWRTSYRDAVDDLLKQADKEDDKKKKAEIGKLLQKYQVRNTQICLEQQDNLATQQWRAIKVESYDGPQEVSQKLQLLQDISREISIGLSRLDQRYEESLREENMRERAQEFVQEGTLFNEGVAVHPTARTPGPTSTFGTLPTPGGNPGNEAVDQGTSTTSGIPQNPSSGDWLSSGNPQKREKEYNKTRQDLLQQQKELQEKILEFQQKEKSLSIP